MVVPHAVLFPHALVPLRIFEPKYRQMLEYCLNADRVFCLTPIHPALSEHTPQSDVPPVAGLGLVRACVAMADGSSNLILQGMARVELAAPLQTAPFLISKLHPVQPLILSNTDLPPLCSSLLNLCTEIRNNGFQVPENFDAQISHLIAHFSDPDSLCDIVAHHLLQNPISRQSVLEERRVAARIRLLTLLLSQEHGL
jgi:Lon protease-like protein